MLQTIKNAWKIQELRQKIIFTLLVLLLYRLGNAIPVPYINVDLLAQQFKSLETTVLGLFNVMSGGAFSQATIFALSIQPYINASIIMQLLTIAIPALERMQKEGGEEGKKKIATITRFATVAIGLLQGLAYYLLIKNYGLLSQDGIWVGIVIVMPFAAGSALLMWLGEQITEFGIGNGISMILFASIISRFPSSVIQMFKNLAAGSLPWYAMLLMLLGALAIVVLIVIVTNAERRIPVQYSKRVVGRKMYGGQSTHLPMKVNMSGVLPVIFAQSITSLLPTIMMMFGKTKESGGVAGAILSAYNTDTVLYAVVYLALIVFFSYFYSTIQFNPVEVANNLKKNGGFVPGIRPGKPTSDFITKVLSKITLFGAVYLAIIAVAPMIISIFSETARNSGISMGGTSVIIVVGVALETVKALESQMLMRHYKGFLE
ncbi:preprotein translocase subunit SecY [Clostridiaceae bacterium OttesenSCG-928-D20]|nr:preprotein translocase subunit SecY [Clostridiaceae bacterium OttesenSCG-928-D20]